MAPPLADLSESDLLDQVDTVRRCQLEAGVEMLRLVAEFARQHGEGTINPVIAQLPGRERAVRLGGEGAPRVAEFAPAVLAARLGLSARAGSRLVADVLDLEHRLPRLWTAVLAHDVDETHARHVARRTRHLTPEEATVVEARVLESADGRLSWTRFETLVEAAIVAADPEAAHEREQASARETFAKPTRSTEHGMRGFYVRADFATIARIDATVAYFAQALLTMGDDTCLDQRRTKAMLILANPAQAMKILAAYGRLRERILATADTELLSTDAPEDPEPGWFDPATAVDPETLAQLAELLDDRHLLPSVQLYVHLADTPTARLEGAHPVTVEWVRDHLGERCHFTIKPVIDPLNQTPVDAYEIPVRHQEAVHLMTPADAFPFAANTTRTVQIDHTVAFSARRRAAGVKQSCIGNYAPLTTHHHRIKTHGGWAVRQPFPGIYLWRDPYGAIYVVDHTGTRRLSRTA